MPDLPAFLDKIDLTVLWTAGLAWGSKLLLALLTLFIGWKISNWIGRLVGKAIDSFEEINDTPEPMIKVAELADSSVNFTVRVWVATPNYWPVHFEMNEIMRKAFDAAGISIPFPTRELNMQTMPRPEKSVAGATPNP